MENVGDVTDKSSVEMLRRYDVSAWAAFKPYQLASIDPDVLCRLLRYAATEIEKFRAVLTGIQEMAAGDISNDPGHGSNIWQIEADARAALATADERDNSSKPTISKAGD